VVLGLDTVVLGGRRIDMTVCGARYPYPPPPTPSTRPIRYPYPRVRVPFGTQVCLPSSLGTPVGVLMTKCVVCECFDDNGDLVTSS
jgi:hypothetical protein